MTRNADAVIIGGGIAGLATGALLAKQGRRVVVLEKGNKPGGRAYAYEERGFTLNYGAHAVYRFKTGVLADVLGRLGREPLPCGVPDPSKAFWADGERFGSIGASPVELMTTKLFPLLDRVRMVPLMASIRMTKAEKIDPEMTYGEWVAKHSGEPSLRRFANALGVVNTYTRHASDLSAAFLIAHYQRTLFAKDYVGYMNGGWATMYEAFIDALQAGGGTLVTGAAVEQLEMDGSGRIVAATAAGERYEAAAFVCTLPPQEATELAAPGTPLASELGGFAAGLEDVRAMSFDLGFSKRLRTDLTFIFDVNEDLYFSLHSEVTPDLAPAGGLLMHAMAYLSPEEAASDSLLRGRREVLLAGLDRHFPGWKEHVVVERRLPNARVASLRQTPEQRAKRLPLRSPAAANLYYANDARDLPYNLSDISLAAAIEASEAIMAAPAFTGATSAVRV